MSTADALVVVDVQAGFLDSYTQRCLPRIHELLAAGGFELVIATQFSNPPDSPFRRLIEWNSLSTPEEIALDPVVEQAADLVVPKTTYSAGAALAAALRQHHISTVTLVGIDTDVCVLQNAAHLFDEGFTVLVDLAGCATGGGPNADAAARPLLERTIGAKQVLGPTR